MKKLKDRIKASGLKQHFVADTFAISRQHLNMMLAGKAKMKVDLEVKINKFLDKY